MSDIAAQMTLYIPGLDPQPATVDIVGVDAASSSSATWRIGSGLTSGIFTEAVSSFHSGALCLSLLSSISPDAEADVVLHEQQRPSWGRRLCT